MSRNVFWSALEAAAAALFSILAAFIIARLIGPTELGIGAAAVAVHVLLWVAVNALFADAIVQRDNIDATVIASAVWASTAVGCAGSVVQAGSGWLLAGLFGDDRLVPMALVLAVPLPFVGLAGALQGLLTRQKRYRALAARTVIGQGSGLVLGVALALAHAGAWAPVVQQAAGSLLAAAVLMCVARWQPMAICRWFAVTSLLRIGLPLTASTLLQIGRYRIFAILIGGIAGPAALGQVHVAFRLVDAVREIAFTALWRLMLPVLSEHQHDSAALLRQVDRLVLLSAVAMMPLCGGLAVALVPLTDLVLGPTWHDAGKAAEPLVGLTALLALMFPSGVALIAVGLARFTFYANLAGLAATVIFVSALRPSSPWQAVLVWCAAQLFVSPYSLWFNARALGVPPLRPLAAGAPMLIVAAAGVAAASAVHAGRPLALLIERGGVFALTVLTCGTALLWWMRSRYFAGAREVEAAAPGVPAASPLREIT